jgi:peroxiredoxin
MFFDRVPVGTHVVSVLKEGYANDEPTKEIVRIMPGDTTEVNFSLSPAEVGQAVGNITPDFELQADFGFLYRLYAYRGFVIIINFWAEDCPNCMKELPYLQEIYDDYLPDTLVIFGLNYEDGFDVIQRIRDEEGLTFILLKDTDGAVKTDYGIVGTPVTIILDRGGKIYFYWQGFQHPSVAQKFRDALDELFGR